MNPFFMLFALFGSMAGMGVLSGGSKSSDTNARAAEDDVPASPDAEPDPLPEPEPQPAPQPVSGSDTATVSEPLSEPVTPPDTASEPAPASVAEPISEPVSEPAAGPSPAPQPVSAPAPEPAAVTEPILGPSQQLQAAPAPEPEIDISDGSVIDVHGGRVTTLNVGEPDDIASVQILDKPDVGNLTVNPDGSLALVLSHPDARDFSGSLDFTYEVTYTDGTTDTVTQAVNVAPSVQLDGWGEGDFYMLETDATGELVIEHGDNHQVVHVTGSDLALSIDEIAQLEGVPAHQIDGQWLAQSDYGTTPDTALDASAGRMLWEELVGGDAEPGSHHLLFEAGYEYDVGRLVHGGAEGESELHPLLISSYGDGDAPVLHGDLRIFQQESANVVIRDIALGDHFQTLEGTNYILDGIDNNGHEISFQHHGTATVRDSFVADSHNDAPSGGDIWSPTADRAQGLYVSNSQGVLLENNFFDLNGWELDYSYDASADAGQAPSLYSHNIYVQRDAGDVTLRDNIILRGASFGAQIRPGGFIEDNVFAGNNIGVNFLGGNPAGDGSLTGNFTLFTDNVVTSGGFHTVDIAEGATTWGVDSAGQQSTLLGNIIAHLVEPGGTLDVRPDYDDGQRTHAILSPGEESNFFDDTLVYNWALPLGRDNFPDTNVEGLDTAILDQTTIEAFTAALLGQSDASLEDLAAYLRVQFYDDAPDLVDADLILDFFQNGFGLSVADILREDGETLRFVPNALGDGIRWDNRLNWDTDDLPGTGGALDNIDLAGNWVFYGGTTTVNDLDLGDGGRLDITHGYLQVDGALETGASGGRIDIDNAGQLWVNGYADSDLLEVDVSGGRFANTGSLEGMIDLDVSDNAQAILANAGADITLGNGSSLSITGSDADVGFDGDDGDLATLHVETGGRIDFVADAGGFSGIGEFRSGHYDQETPDVVSGADLGGGTLGIDISALGDASLSETLIAADEIIGNFDAIELIGLGADRDAALVFDYDNDVVNFSVTASGEGSGVTDVTSIGDMSNASNAALLWAALTDGQGTYTAADLPDIAEVDEFSDAIA